MQSLREEIRAILREEIAALRSESQSAMPAVERVSITSSADLNRFAQDIVRRSAEPEFAAHVARGGLVFELVQNTAPINGPIISSPRRVQPTTYEKTLITERDIANLDASVRSLRIAPHSRLTPLARDEARRLGIRIERTEK